MSDNDGILVGDEGMWPLNMLPLDRIDQRYGFAPTDSWIDSVRGASVRLSSGGSASFVSSTGLVLTNHHVAESRLEAVSTEARDHLRNGFYAVRLGDEIPCPGLEANILASIEDVTHRVKSVVSDNMLPEQAFLARRAEIAKIEQESQEATGLRSNVVTLYQGGAYHLYQYFRYEDVRIVWAPEKAIAGFGGDPDNYEFPRFCLDATLLRVWHEGAPLVTPHFFRIAEEALTDGELLLVSGHPGTTNRMSTVSRLVSLRDSGMPYTLEKLHRSEICLQQYAGKSVENRRRSLNALHGVQNYRKRMRGQQDALQDPTFMDVAVKREERIQSDLQKSGLWDQYAHAWQMVDKAERVFREIRVDVNLYEGGGILSTRFFGIAETLFRMVHEDEKEDKDRLPEFTSSFRPSLMLRLMSPEPVYADLEECTLADSLAAFAEKKGIESDEVQLVLCGKSPQEVAREMVAGTKLGELSERQSLVDGGRSAVEQSKDPFIKIASLLDERSRAIRRRFEVEVVELRKRAYSMIAEALFKLYGADVYPDATSTLRLVYGKASPYRAGGRNLSMFTTIGEVFDHADFHESERPWQLPDRWCALKEILSTCDVPFNFLSTHDTHGGNSGSPVFDKDLRLHGVLFDGLFWEQGRSFLVENDNPDTISVSAYGILEVLRRVYNAERIVNELTAS